MFMYTKSICSRKTNVFFYPQLLKRGGNVIAGTLEALTHHLIPTESYFPDPSFIFAFLLTSRLLIEPYELVDKVFHTLIEFTPPSNTLEDPHHLVCAASSYIFLYYGTSYAF